MDESLEGRVVTAETPDELRAAVEQAFGYRGDVTITLRDGRQIVGYLFDRRDAAAFADGNVRIMPAEGGSTVTVQYSDIASLAFTGRDTAAGKSYETWLRKQREKKGET